MASVYSGAGEGRYGTVTVRGQVEFGLQYNYKAGALEIHIKQVSSSNKIKTSLTLTVTHTHTVQRFGAGGCKAKSQ